MPGYLSVLFLFPPNIFCTCYEDTRCIPDEGQVKHKLVDMMMLICLLYFLIFTSYIIYLYFKFSLIVRFLSTQFFNI